MKLNKYTKVYFRLIDRARGRKIQGYCEKHHVLPISLGGTNARENLVRLTAREHFFAHLLLTKMTDGEALRKMRFALNAMLTGTCKQPRYIPPRASRIFEIARRSMCEAQTGKLASAETRAKMSASHIGMLNSEQSKQRLSEAKFGVSLTDIHKSAISMAQTGRARGPYTRHVSKNNYPVNRASRGSTI